MGHMKRHQRPIFGFLWPAPDPHAPRDDDYRQTRRVRITPRGPIRLLVLALATVMTVFLLTAALLTAIAAPLSAATFLSAGIAATCVGLVLRGWVAGTYVNDDGVIVETVMRRRSVPWTAVERVACLDGRARLLGTPVQVPGRRVVVLTASAETIDTHVQSTSPDLMWRPEAFDIARERLENWASAT